MSDHDDDHDDNRPTPIPEPGEPLPPWERGTETDRKIPPEFFGKTQPIHPPTVEDVLVVFGLFRQDLLGQIDKRDERILLAIRDIGTTISAHYQRETARGDRTEKGLREETKRGDEHAKMIGQLRKRTHKLSSEQQALNIRLAIIEQHLGITPPVLAPPSEPEPA